MRPRTWSTLAYACWAAVAVALVTVGWVVVGSVLFGVVAYRWFLRR